MLSKPSIKFFEPHLASLVEVQQERKRVGVVEIQPAAVDVQERRCHGHGDAFVSIHERLDQVAVVSAPGTRNADSNAARSRIPKEPPNRAINFA